MCSRNGTALDGRCCNRRQKRELDSRPMHEGREGPDEAAPSRGWRWFFLGILALAGVVAGLFVAGRIFERGPFGPSFPGPLPVEVVDSTPAGNGSEDSSPTEYFLHMSSDWDLQEAVNPDEDWQFAEPEPSLDWYAEYEYQPDLSQTVRLSGHRGALERIHKELPGFDLHPVGVRGGDGLGGRGGGGDPSVVLFEARGDYAVMILSYEHDVEQLATWAKELRHVSEEEWVAAGGIVGNPTPFVEE